MIEEKLENYLNKDGKIIAYPGKKHKAIRPLLYEYLISKFDDNKEYSEKEVNDIIRSWILFDDYVIFRRELFEVKLLNRTIDGSRYWKNKKEN